MTKTFHCIDAHTCGNPVRLVKHGGPVLVGKDMSEKRQHFLQEFDWIRKGLMYEPRGHDMMSGSILYPPHHPENDVAVLFIETSGCLPMCGHGTIGTITIAIEEGLIQPKVEGVVKMEAPAGLVNISYKMKDKKVASVKLTNVASYLAATELSIDCPDLAPTLITTAAAMRLPYRFTGLQTLAHKESNRTEALRIELAKIGAELKEEAGICFINYTHPYDYSKALVFDTHQDHRMAMCLAPLALQWPNITIHHAAVVEKSYRSFWDDFAQTGLSLNLQ